MQNIKSKWNQLDRPIQLGAAAAAAVLMVMMVWKILPAIIGAMGLGLFVAILIVPYWIPSIVAVKRGHASKGGIIALNFFFGWTFLGWVLSLVWALSNSSNGAGQTVVVHNNMAPAPARYQVGDVVNGQRFNGSDWTPLPAATEVAAPALEAPQAEAQR